jgi:hypothetical protein
VVSSRLKNYPNFDDEICPNFDVEKICPNFDGKILSENFAAEMKYDKMDFREKEEKLSAKEKALTEMERKQLDRLKKLNTERSKLGLNLKVSLPSELPDFSWYNIPK